MDLSNAIIARSDQLNAADLVGGPRTFTVREVRDGSEDQPCSIFLAEWPGNRPFKPSKTVMRILAHAWGLETDDWPAGARMTLFRDEAVKWAGQEVGGIRVSHLSHIKGQIKIALKESQKKTVLHVIDPLPDAPTPPQQPSEPSAEEVAACVDKAELTAMWKRSGADMRKVIEQRVADLDNEPEREES